MPRLQKSQEEETASTPSLVPAVEQAGRILLCLAQNAPSRMNLTDICRKVGIHKSKGYNIMNTLRNFGFVTRENDGKLYSLGPGLISLGRKVLDNLHYKDAAEPFLERLADKTGTAAFFGLIADGNVFIVAKHETGANMGVSIRLGHRYPISHGAHGKAAVAFMPERERAAVLRRRELFFHGDPSNLDRERLLAELERCRERGYAEDIGEQHPGINGVASPVFVAEGKLIGTLFVIGLFPRERVEEYGALVAEAALQLSMLFGADEEVMTRNVSKR
jgi:DNA-binding IclR family transcriptional regulator